jgi:hypothetical protein
MMSRNSVVVVAASVALGVWGGCGGGGEPTGDAGTDGRPSVCDVGEPIPPHDGPECAQTTHDCLRLCSDPELAEECTEACLADDPDCLRCVSSTLAACFNEVCQPEWDAFACCTEGQCDVARTGADRAWCWREEGRCAPEYDAYVECTASLDRDMMQACGRRAEQRCDI